MSTSHTPTSPPAYRDAEAWLDLWLYEGRPGVPYRKNLLDAMGMAVTTDSDEIIAAIGDVMSARRAAGAAADVYMTKRAMLDGAMRRLSGKEDEEPDR